MSYIEDRADAAADIAEAGKLLTIRYPGEALRYWVYTYDPVLGDTWTLKVPDDVVITLTSLDDEGTLGQYGKYQGELYQYNGTWQKCTLVVHSDPGTIPVDYQVYALELSYSDSDYANESIKFGDRKFMVSALSNGVAIPKPNVGGILFVGDTSGTQLNIVRVDPFEPGDMALYYDIQARS